MTACHPQGANGQETLDGSAEISYTGLEGGMAVEVEVVLDPERRDIRVTICAPAVTPESVPWTSCVNVGVNIRSRVEEWLTSLKKTAGD